MASFFLGVPLQNQPQKDHPSLKKRNNPAHPDCSWPKPTGVLGLDKGSPRWAPLAVGLLESLANHPTGCSGVQPSWQVVGGKLGYNPLMRPPKWNWPLMFSVGWPATSQLGRTSELSPF